MPEYLSQDSMSKPTIIFATGFGMAQSAGSKISSRHLNLMSFTRSRVYDICWRLSGKRHQACYRSMAELIEAEVSKGRNVNLVNYSFGGSVGSSGAKGYTEQNPSRLKEGYGCVIGICQVCAFSPPDNTALIDMSGPREHGRLFYDRDSDGWEDRDVYVGILKKQRSDTYEGPPVREGAYARWMEVPTWYLLCIKDIAIPIDLQEYMVGEAREMGADLTTRRLDADQQATRDT
ncbi:hypothetical protein OIDMADRAFT_56454 [Oidiodendron maius Zn]|uniref:AB hydrolase-1 domain-containing protein n=1 Tax=Oidiodendron maius (strain Zn) TaxID=913774 RepID=A0A0C3DBJ8_OIDMZ|nr:hypothetical protein OIDMADRAFT_56454 [Oidiodendron maius Zn]